MKKLILFIFLAFSVFIFAQEPNTFTEKEISVTPLIDGTLLIPNSSTNKLAIIIAGSGPTDRDGNQNFLKTNNLKKLAVNLTNRNIATFRYDKRVVKQIRRGNLDPKIKFDDFINDARAVLKYFEDQKTYDKIYIIGHSQGSLIGMVAARDGADGFISISGSGNSIDKVINEQIEKTAPMYAEDSKRVFNILKEGKTTDNYPPALASIFNKDIQPFIANWMSYQPQEEIKKLSIPILIINGTKDLQVSVEEARILNAAAKNSELKLIEKMNHVLFIIEGDELENSKSYNDQAGIVSEELINAIDDFIAKQK